MTKEMINDLLKEKFKVIAPIPWTHFRVGEIVSNESLRGYKENNVYATKMDLSNFPHLFKRMQWFEDRTEDQMPEFVRYQSKGEDARYIRVFKHFTNRDGAFNIYGFMFENEFYSYKHCTPITEEEYFRAIKN